MLTRDRPPERDWRVHVFYRNANGEREDTFDVTAPHEDMALDIAERRLRNKPQRAHVRITYMEAVTL